MFRKKLYCVQHTKWRIRKYECLQISSFNIFFFIIITLWHIKLPYFIENILSYCCIIIPSRFVSRLIYDIISLQKLINLISHFPLYGQYYLFCFYVLCISLRIWNKQRIIFLPIYSPSINITLPKYFKEKRTTIFNDTLTIIKSLQNASTHPLSLPLSLLSDASLAVSILLPH